MVKKKMVMIFIYVPRKTPKGVTHPILATHVQFSKYGYKICFQLNFFPSN